MPSHEQVPAEVRTERLLLRPWRPGDLDAYAAIVGDPVVSRYLGDGAPVNREGAWRQMAVYTGHLVLRGYSHWAIELLGTGEFIGRAGPWRPEGWPALEIGWTIAPRHQGRGYATEAGRVARDVSWRCLRPQRLVSLVRPGNEASAAVARKLGGVLEEEIDLMGGDAWVFAYPKPPA